MQKVNQNYLIARVVKFLNENGYVAWRQENNGRIDEQQTAVHMLKLFEAFKVTNYTVEKKIALIKEALRKFYKRVPCSRKGVTDVIGWDVMTARWIIVEVKCGNDIIRPEQKEFMDELRESGGSVWVCRDFDCWSEALLKKRAIDKERDPDGLSFEYLKAIAR